MIEYVKDTVTGFAHPALYPGEKQDTKSIPDEIQADYSKLNSIIEMKYTREYLKICAFYNKLFPSLKSSNWTRSSYNAQPFTALDQERTDTGTGVSTNYLKQITDQLVSRLGTVSFDAKLVADIPTLEFIIYKDEIERLLRKIIRNEQLNRLSLEMFHNAAVLGYSHVLMDPITHTLIKMNDYECGIHEAQWNHNEIKQLLYRDFAFPVTSLKPYIKHCDIALQKELMDQYKNSVSVDFKMFIDCDQHKVYIFVHNTKLPEIDYPFDTVQMCTFAWDVGFSKVTSTSLFDLLYPSQRELNKIKAKIQQLVRLYKGAIPVFNSDVDLAMKSISNGSGECLYVDSTRPVDSMVTVINPTPLDTALDALVTSIKTEMLELASVQSASFDMENMRSAASIIAVDQTRDTTFQAQMDGIATFQKDLFRMIVNCNAAWEGGIWQEIKKPVDEGVIELKPVHVNDPLGNKGAIETEEPDYVQIQTARFAIAVLKGVKTFADVDYKVDKQQVNSIVASLITKLDAFGIAVPDTLEAYMVQAFIDDVENGLVPLAI